MGASTPWLGDVEMSALETKTIRVIVTIVIAGEPSSTERLRCGAVRMHHVRGKADTMCWMTLGWVKVKMRREV